MSSVPFGHRQMYRGQGRARSQSPIYYGSLTSLIFLSWLAKSLTICDGFGFQSQNPSNLTSGVPAIEIAEAGSDQISAMRSKHPAQLEEPLAMSAIANA